ncbi:hypothetical protein [Tepidiforma thermophila]|uniref:Uncharacterized protein n=1 Tax=Tepidiforma thermophila (strain KCTC 52669 / CGMCC 1.13589 / G233) TaxID=2761530 RepID=A0A2A9HDR0_TEPT2|nr:hypothetical protein [Tepidiforma thermophila]PFG73126.1 hypothetical protein A9A59_0320 [Tepidiforma thermophila]
MRRLQPVPRSDELPAEGERVTLVAGERRRVLYVEGDASLEVIMAALEAWGLRVRAERERQQAAPGGAGEPAPGTDQAEGVPAWVTQRPALPRVNRLENVLSPLWFPARRPVSGTEPVTAFSWFGRAA